MCESVFRKKRRKKEIQKINKKKKREERRNYFIRAFLRIKEIRNQRA